MQQHPQVAMLIDNRTNRPEDFLKATAITVTGKAQEISPPKRREATALFLARHPYLQDFINGTDCALMEMGVEKYLVVREFQQVKVVAMDGKQMVEPTSRKAGHSPL